MVIKGWVLFVDTEKGDWKSAIWRMFTCEDFRHVVVVQKMNYSGKDYFTIIDPSMGWMAFRPLLEFKDENISEFGLVYGYDVSHIVEFEVEPERELTIRGLYSCVGVVKQIMGVTDYNVWSPKALYNLLINKYKFKEIPLC